MIELTELEHLESDVVIFISSIVSEKLDIEELEKELLDKKYWLKSHQDILCEKRDRIKKIKKDV